MALDLYSSCPCGSGKKFKWCCQPIHVQIEKAFQQEADGQHETALRIMEEVIVEHPSNPEALGRKAELLYIHGKAEEAENTLEKAFAINPNYPFGHYLRGIFRRNEGELAGAILLLRKAAELYDPEAHDQLGRLQVLIAECEIQSNHPLAAYAAMKLAWHFLPGVEEIRQTLEHDFGEKSHMPAAARREYAFKSPPAGAGGVRREAWNRALAVDAKAKLSAAVSAFEQLTAEDPQDAAAWHNLGLARAWRGDNRGALEAVNHYVALEPDETQAADAWTLAEVLRLGRGMEEQADYITHSAFYEIREPEKIVALLNEWQNERRLILIPSDQESGVVMAIVLERKPALTPELAATQMLGIGAHMLIMRNVMRLWHTNAPALAEVRAELEQYCGPTVTATHQQQTTAPFGEVLAESIAFPASPAPAPTDKEAYRKRILEHHQRFFEERWIHRPLKSLDLAPPVDAAGHPVLRKKLLGVIRFLEDCAAATAEMDYDFNRLRRKLGLQAGGPVTPAEDISAMSAAELAALQIDSLNVEQLGQAFQTSLKLDARDLAAQFARTLVARPAPAGQPCDRYPYYSHLVQAALAENHSDAALSYLSEAEKADSELNEGRRLNDYQLRRGQIHAKRGETDAAQHLFEQIVERSPAELRYRGSAAEAMLSAKQPARALHFAEAGLAEARKKNDRDSEQYFLELVTASKRG